MVNQNLFYTGFKQTYNSCVIASFAVSSHYYNPRVTPQEFLKSFCIFYDEGLAQFKEDICAENLFWEKQYEFVFAKKLHELSISGNALMKKYFEESSQKLFERCRKIFTVDYVEVKDDNSLQQKLKDKESILVASFKQPNGGYHSISIGFDIKKQDYFYIDTNFPDQINPFHKEYFSVLGDGLYLNRI